MLDAHQLNVFLEAADALSFTQAAQRLHMTQPSVSQHIQTLE
ncbi:MAG: LysR family transcriptional regulator, partial [Chloroflexi bacterium]|nr:LysR family transcriptional regulator [Chloroflexota bacterium]